MRDAKSSDIFSIREGIIELDKEIQSEEIDDELKNSLWNAVFRYYLDVGKIPSTVVIQEDASLKEFFEKILYDFYKVPADSIINGFLGHGIEEIRELFYNLKWNKVYDFIEFLANNITERNSQDANAIFHSQNIAIKY